jgi:hypothetical protein
MTGRAMAPNIGTPIVLWVCRLAALLIDLAGCSAGGGAEKKTSIPMPIRPHTKRTCPHTCKITGPKWRTRAKPIFRMPSLISSLPIG